MLDWNCSSGSANSVSLSAVEDPVEVVLHLKISLSELFLTPSRKWYDKRAPPLLQEHLLVTTFADIFSCSSVNAVFRPVRIPSGPTVR